MKPIKIPENYNYIGIFFTFGCNLKCSYCINRHEEGNFPKGIISGKEWVKALNRIETISDIPITFQGGEPSTHPDFMFIINNLNESIPIDILTNLEFDVDKFIATVNPQRLKRDAHYAPIRVSYHPEQQDIDKVAERMLKMHNAGFSIALYGVMHPSQKEEILKAQKRCKELGVDFRTKEFLGIHEGKLHGTYKYPNCCENKQKKNVLCKTTELIIGPTGGVYRCHSDIYENRKPIGNIFDADFEIKDEFRPCSNYGHCNPCDVKVKTNRLQQFGHTSVEIKNPDGSKHETINVPEELKFVDLKNKNLY
tara:strand:+ start:7225 stop:8151 length:927 start_codon:yes stop_codon:yes gene_type:complete